MSIKAEAAPKSLVAILGGDLALSFLGLGNLISESYLEDTLAFDISSYNFKLKSKLHGIFGQINGFALSPTSTKKHACSELEKELLKPAFDGRSGADTEIALGKTIGEDKPSVVRKNFPEIWIYEFKEVDDSGEVSWDMDLPDSITTWMISGYALNQEKCLAIAPTEKIVALQDFFIKLEKPHSIIFGETVDVKVIVYNYLNVSGTATVTLKNLKSEYTFVTGDIDSQSLTTFVEQGKTSSVTFTIQPKVFGKVMLNVDGFLEHGRDEVEDFLIVRFRGITKFTTKEATVDLTLTNELPPIEFDFEIPDDHIKDTVQCAASASNHIIQLDVIEKIDPIP